MLASVGCCLLFDVWRLMYLAGCLLDVVRDICVSCVVVVFVQFLCDVYFVCNWFFAGYCLFCIVW